MATDLDFLTIAQAARLIRDSEVSPREVVDHLLRRIQNLDPQLNPFITVTADDARRQARRAEDEIMPARGAGRCTAYRSASKTFTTRRGS